MSVLTAVSAAPGCTVAPKTYGKFKSMCMEAEDDVKMLNFYFGSKSEANNRIFEDRKEEVVR